MGVKFSKFFEIFESSKNSLYGVLWVISSKFFKILPFETILKRKTLIFWKNLWKCIEFLADFSRKIWSHRTTQSLNFRKFFLKNVIKHGCGGPIEQRTRPKFWGTPLPPRYLWYGSFLKRFQINPPPSPTILKDKILRLDLKNWFLHTIIEQSKKMKDAKTVKMWNEVLIKIFIAILKVRKNRKQRFI